MENNLFIKEEALPWETVGDGIQRKILAYDASLMLVKVAFEEGSIGAVHQHPHVQITQVQSGLFEVEVSGQKKVLQAGDCFYAPSNEWHGVVCLQAGVLLDAFSPMREDFLK